MKSRPHLISVVGARPQFIKLAPLAPALARRFRHTIVHTGQHYDHNMSGLFFRQLKIPKASINLSIGGVGHGAMTGRMIEQLESLFLKQKPAAVLVYGDTNSTMAGALAAAKLSVTIAHVEAGLRSYVPDMPEEINRRVTDHLAQLLFCPTIRSMQNLKREGIKGGLVHAGDLMYELLQNSRKTIASNLKLLGDLRFSRKEFGLLTFHRASNTDRKENLQALCDILAATSVPILFPVHPRTRKKLRQFNLLSRLQKNKRVILSEPLGYHDLLSAACHARFVMTDSGGLQKEALFLGTPVLTLREETEWVELLKLGNRLVGLDVDKIMRSWKRLPRVHPIEFKIGRRRPSEVMASSLASYLKGV